MIEAHPSRPMTVDCPYCDAVAGTSCDRKGAVPSQHVQRYREAVRVYLKQARERAEEYKRERRRRERWWLDEPHR